MIKPTMPAPDFIADGLQLGQQISVRLRDYVNHWVLLFFYSSDFTFV